MKKWLKLIGIVFCMVVSLTIFSACDFGSSDPDDTDVNAPTAIEIPSEIRVSGYENEIEVGDSFITKLKVEAKFDETWQEVVKADYQYTCSYNGSKYGEYDFKVYMKEFPSIEYSDIIDVKPKTVMLPESYSTMYTGEIVNIKQHYENISGGLYEVQSYLNMTNCGTYSVTLRLKDSDMYVWCDEEGNQYKNPTQKISWHITKTSPKVYTGITSFVAYQGDTLYDVLIDNNLSHITWYRDSANNDVTTSIKVTNGTTYYAHYNENPENYENTLVTFTISDFITTANYTIEYYFYDGSDYIIDNSLTKIISGNIGDYVNAEIDTYNGYVYDLSNSVSSGKILKQDGLVLKIYFDLSE